MSESEHKLRTLILEDSEDDARLAVMALERQGYALDWERVDTEEGLVDALAHRMPDVVLADHVMPKLDSIRALELLRERDREIPFVLVSGTIGEEAAADMLRRGANHFVSKGNLNRIGSAVQVALAEARMRAERARAEEALRQSERRYRSLVMATSDFLWWCRADGSVYEIYPEWLEYTGFTPEQALDWDSFEAIHADDRDAYLSGWLEAVRTGSVFEHRYRLRRRDGACGWFFDRGAPVHDAKGEVTEWVGASRDITVQVEAEERLRESEEKYRRLFDDASNGIFLLDDARIVDCNETAVRIFGYRRDKLVGMTPIELSPEYQPDGRSSRDKTQAFIRAALDGEPQRFEWEHVREDGRVMMAQVSLGRLDGVAGANLHAILTDVTEQRHTEMEMHKLSRALQQSADAIIITDAQQVIEYVNPAFERITGYAATEAVGRTADFLASDHDEPEVRERLRADIEAGREFHGVLVNRRRSGELYYADMSIAPVRDEAGALTQFIASHYDITDKLRAERELAHLVHFDPLTDLPNRSLMIDRLEYLLTQVQRFGWRVAVMQVDLDGFSLVNESWGKEGGDHVLRTVGQRLAEAAGVDMPVGRIGNDGFVVLALLTDERDRADGRASALQHVIGAPIHYQGESITVTGTMGLALAPEDSVDAEQLLRHAETALHRAQRQGREEIAFYAPAMSDEARHWLSVESGLRRALEKSEFRLEYQPQVDLHTGRLSGVEGLLRWDDPERGPVSPGEFVPMLEATGLIVPVGEWVIREACRRVCDWHTHLAAAGADGKCVRVAVNLSLTQLERRDLVTVVQEALEATGADARCLELELTESSLARNPDEATRMLETLRELGVSVALDDFGVGYSSLNYLKRFPIDVVKVDRVFVDEVTRDPGDAAILRAVLALARSRGMKTIAEGVETDEQVRFLFAEGCRHVQGFHFSRPVRPEELRRLLERERPFAVTAGSPERQGPPADR